MAQWLDHPGFELWGRLGAPQVEPRQQQTICGQRQAQIREWGLVVVRVKLARTPHGIDQKKKKRIRANLRVLILKNNK